MSKLRHQRHTQVYFPKKCVTIWTSWILSKPFYKTKQCYYFISSLHPVKFQHQFYVWFHLGSFNADVLIRFQHQSYKFCSICYMDHVEEYLEDKRGSWQNYPNLLNRRGTIPGTVKVVVSEKISNASQVLKFHKIHFKKNINPFFREINFLKRKLFIFFVKVIYAW